MRMFGRLALITALSLGAVDVSAQDYDVGFAAMEKRDYKTALREFAPLATQGNAKAQMWVGLIYERGLGVPKDYYSAIKWLRLAANQGQSQSQTLLGKLNEGGNGIPQNNVIAHMWYNIASANGDVGAPKLRDDLEAKMTAEDISKAQAMASECMSSGYKKCG